MTDGLKLLLTCGRGCSTLHLSKAVFFRECYFIGEGGFCVGGDGGEGNICFSGASAVLVIIVFLLLLFSVLC